MDELMAQLADSVWALPLLFLVVLGDAFLVVLPGEAAVTVYGALAVAEGRPPLTLVIITATLAAASGDVCCYLVGRAVGLDRWQWMRRPRARAAFAWARVRLDRRVALVVFTARFIPFARLAVNLVAGASRVRAARYLTVVALAATAWAVYQALVGAAVAAMLPDNTVLAVLVSVVIAVGTGILTDVVLARRSDP